MREQVEAKLKQAQEQQAQWQQQIMQAQEQQRIAQEQAVRWDAIRLFCQELLAQHEDEHEDTKGHEKDEADTAG